jgi:multidrug efflux pump subunit AcrB
MGAVVGVFAIALWGFGYVDRSFFPSSTRPQFMIDLWLPQGTHIEETKREAASIEEYLLAQEGVNHVTSLLGQGGLRFLLTYQPEKLNGIRRTDVANALLEGFEGTSIVLTARSPR